MAGQTAAADMLGPPAGGRDGRLQAAAHLAGLSSPSIVTSLVIWQGCIAVFMELQHPVYPPMLDMGSGSDSDDDHGVLAPDPQPQPAPYDDAGVLAGLLASLQVPFAAGQQVMAEVDGRVYHLVRNAVGAAADWDHILQPLPGPCAGPADAQAPRPRQLHFAAPLCVLVSSASAMPLSVRVCGRGLGGEGVQFSALVQGRHLPCTHTSLCASSGMAQGSTQGVAGQPGEATVSWVQVHVPCLGQGVQPGLLLLECRLNSPAGDGSRRSTSSSYSSGNDELEALGIPLGVTPVLLLDSSWMSIELGELQQDLQRLAQADDQAALENLYSLVWDLGEYPCMPADGPFASPHNPPHNHTLQMHNQPIATRGCAHQSNHACRRVFHQMHKSTFLDDRLVQPCMNAGHVFCANCTLMPSHSMCSVCAVVIR